MSFCCGKSSSIFLQHNEISGLDTMMLIYFSSILFLAGFAEAGYQGRRQSAHGNGTTSLNSSPCAVVSQSAAAALASAATGMLIAPRLETDEILMFGSCSYG
jgi:hypothetical protein